MAAARPATHGQAIRVWRYCDMAAVELVIVPYDSGQRGVRMGRGPGYLVERGLPGALAGEGHEVTVTEVASAIEPAAEIAVAFELARGIAAAVQAAREAGRLPLVLAGNCFSAIGTVAGLDPNRTGVLWLDAHGDLNTPETTRSGMLDGMALAALSGRCWRGLSTTVPGFLPLPDHRLALVGARDLDPPEEALAAALGIRRIRCAEVVRQGPQRPVAALVDRMSQVVDQCYLHVDLDVLDPGVATVNEFSAPGGLRLEDVLTIIDLTGQSCGIAGASITAYDPEFDADGRAADAAFAIALAIAAARDRGTRRPGHPEGSEES
jgi:arginase